MAYYERMTMTGFQKVIATTFEDKGLGHDTYSHWFHILGRVRSGDLVTFVEIIRESTKDDILVFTENLRRNMDHITSSDRHIELHTIVRHEKLIKA